MHNAQDAAWVANKWGAAREGGKEYAAALVAERQHLYQEFTMQMHGKNRQMLRGYTIENKRVTGGADADAARSYSADPCTRYNRYHHDCLSEWTSTLTGRGRATSAQSVSSMRSIESSMRSIE
jgi:hypothetical protein